MVRRKDKVNWADPTLLILGSLSEGPKQRLAFSCDPIGPPRAFCGEGLDETLIFEAGDCAVEGSRSEGDANGCRYVA